jgi:hypothetical protein
MMSQKRMPWDRPPGSSAPNRQGDYFAEPIFTALGRALSAWEGVNAAANSLFHALHSHMAPADRDAATKAYDGQHKTHDRAQILRVAGEEFLTADFKEMRDEAAKFKRRHKELVGQYVEWAARRNDLAHGYVTEAQSPDYSREDQPIVTVYALLPSHARVDRWYHEEPEWNYLATEIEEIARRFRFLDDELEKLARKVGDLLPYRKASK